MKTALQITFRQMDSSPSVEAAVAKEVEHLERIHPSVRACQVVIEAPHRHQRLGRHFHVSIRLAVPGAEVVASRDPGLDAGHEDVYLAVRDAFRAARRELGALASRHEPQACLRSNG